MSKSFSLFTLGIKNLRRKPLRTGILVFSIGVLVATLVFALSFSRRVDSGIKLMSDRLGADLLIVPTGSRGAAEDVLLENKVKSFYMDKSIVDRVMQINGIDRDNVTHHTYITTLWGVCCDVPEAMIIAFNQDTDFVINPWLREKLGRKLKKGEAIVGSESALNISFGLMEVDSVLFGNVFKMVGVLDKTGTGFDNAIFIDENNIDDILKKGKSDIKPDQISVILAKVKKGQDPYKVARDIEDNIIETDTMARKDIGKSLISTLRDINAIFLITIILASVLSIFLTWSVFSAVANERAREIGIMRAIGAKESHVATLFFLEIILISCIGCVLGIIGGTTLSFMLAKSFTIMKDISTDLSIFERLLIALTGLLIGVGVCIFGAFFPMNRLKKTEPLIVIKEG